MRRFSSLRLETLEDRTAPALLSTVTPALVAPTTTTATVAPAPTPPPPPPTTLGGPIDPLGTPLPL